MKLQDKQALFTHNVAKLIEYMYTSGFKVTLGEAWRTKEQAEIYAKSGIGIKESLHCKRLAIDLNLFSAEGIWLTAVEAYRPFGLYWEELNEWNRWGGAWKKVDSGHFEMQDFSQ